MYRVLLILCIMLISNIAYAQVNADDEYADIMIKAAKKNNPCRLCQLPTGIFQSFLLKPQTQGLD